MQQRRFAAARRPHQRDQLAGLNGKADAAQRRDAAAPAGIHFMDVVHDKKRQAISRKSKVIAPTRKYYVAAPPRQDAAMGGLRLAASQADGPCSQADGLPID